MQEYRGEIAYLGVFISLALIFSYVESLIPIHFAVPGMKLGLANVVVVVALYKLGLKESFLISTIRVIVAGFLFSNLMTILFSLAGCTLSILAMSLLYRKEQISVMGISIIGAVFHNLGQVLIAIIVVESFQVMYYFALLLVSGVITGLMIGIIAYELMRRLNILGEMR